MTPKGRNVSFIYSRFVFFSVPLFFLSPKKRFSSLANRLGFLNNPNFKKPIWIHAVSVGEVLSIKGIISSLKKNFPNESIVISTTTTTGQEVAKSRYPFVDTIIYFPFDFNFSVTRALKTVDPKMVITTETEIWPNFLLACHRKDIPVIWINGRISDKSYPRYLWVRGFLKKVLDYYTLIGMQSEIDCERILAMGANPKKVSSMGNLKYDIDLSNLALPEPLKRTLSSTKPLWIAASIMPEEEEIALETFNDLRSQYPGLKLMIAPRHPHRFDEVAKLLEKSGFSSVRRSNLSSNTKAQVILLDSLGELAATFQFADVVFVGGSLIPHGGHNILEPAFYSKPIVFGPHMENFREISRQFLEAKAAIQVQSAKQLTEAIDLILSDPNRAEALGQNARRIVDENRGATEKAVSWIREELEKRGNPH